MTDWTPGPWTHKYVPTTDAFLLAGNAGRRHLGRIWRRTDADLAILSPRMADAIQRWGERRPDAHETLDALADELRRIKEGES